MPLLWLRLAVVFYGLGLVYSLLLLSRRGEALTRFVGPAVGMGMIFQLVSLVEFAVLEGKITASVHHSESLLAFVIMVVFMIFFVRYRTSSPGIFVFPLVFFLTFASATGPQGFPLSSPLLKNSWTIIHIVLIFTGYAGLFLSFGASLLYLIQEKSLKSKQPASFAGRLPALQTIDEIGYRALLLGFPFMTFGLVAGSVLAENKFGSLFFLDAKVLLSIIMWVVYMVLLYTRWNSGWRGRKAAYLAAFAFIAAVGAWAANYFSHLHRFSAS
ncbi:cytochrome c assembly protein [Candidatus Koribacter versatilis Ellin345]|uniref:Cytochrome c assembly protein n=1 Tax=Koribacter versatilis (strain Ellin345) TaxID=204669 RepID=Q1INI4_KORVE|nr:cytochrome c biogenesis protein CcsA [Candidatus Koribacter versatilis]ABF41566.1 cytochrome c assembly protein [Candidatus Koribacter versatilis Ellin345]